jgi:hypothetical protein
MTRWGPKSDADGVHCVERNAPPACAVRNLHDGNRHLRNRRPPRWCAEATRRRIQFVPTDPGLQPSSARPRSSSPSPPAAAARVLVRAANNPYLCYVVIAVYVATSLSPLLSSGYYSDDLVNSTTKAYLELHGISLFQHLLSTAWFWTTYNGRFFPVAILTTGPISYLSYNLHLYKILLLSLTVFNVLLFGLLTALITRSRQTSCLAMLFLPILFQFRLYHDPLLSLSGMMQILAAFVFLAMIFLYKHLEHPKAAYLIASLLSYNLALYLYEVSTLLIALFLITLARQNHLRAGHKLRIAVFYTLSMMVALIAQLAARLLREPTWAGYSGLQFNADAVRASTTFLLQLSASLPLSYYAGNPSHLFLHSLASVAGNITACDIVVLTLFIVCYSIFRGTLAGTRGLSTLCLLGSALMLLPAVPVSMSVKYQDSLRALGPGMGYIPVYLQYYGTALLMVGGVAFLLRHLPGKNTRILANIAVIGVLAAALLVNMQSNRLVVDKANIDLHYRRAAVARALAEHILVDVPEHATLFIDDEYTLDPYPFVTSDLKGWGLNGYPWKSDNLVYLYAGKRVQIINDLDGLLKHFRSRNATGDRLDDVYCLTIKSYPDNSGIKEGYVVLSRIRNISVDGAGTIQVESTPLRSSFPPESSASRPLRRESSAPCPAAAIGCSAGRAFVTRHWLAVEETAAWIEPGWDKQDVS